eukprot:598600_1
MQAKLDTENLDQKDEYKQTDKDEEDISLAYCSKDDEEADLSQPETCTVHDVFNSFVSHAVMIDIRASNEYGISHICEAIHIDPQTIDKPNKYINQSKFGKTLAIYGPKHITTKYINIVQFISTQFTPKSVKVLDEGYDAFKRAYPFICAAHGCEAKLYPSCIIPNKLYLGRQRTRFSEKALHDLKITHIVDVTAFKFPVDANIKVLKLPLADSEEEDIQKHFAQAIQFMDDAFGNNENNRVFVHCQMGVSRSTTITLAWLMKSKGYTLVDAYVLCQKCRPMIHPNDGFFKQLVAYEETLYGKSTDHEINALKLRETN